MTEIDDIRSLLEQGFRAAMILREPTEDEIRQLPEVYAASTVRALPLMHADGRKLMYYLSGPAAVEFAQGLVEEQKAIIGYDLCVYCSGIGPDTIHGRKLHLDSVVESLQQLLGWDVVTSEYPHTFEVSFKIEGDDQAALDHRLGQVHKIALALSLHNRLGFVVGSTSPGTRYQGQPFPLRWGLEERSARTLSGSHLAYIDKVCNDPNALAAAEALQALYSQVSDDSRITVGWAAIEDIFASPAQHLLAPAELEAVLEAVEQIEGVPRNKWDRFKTLLRNPDLLSQAGRNERLARGICELTGFDFEDVYEKVRSLARERARRVHKLSVKSRPLAQHVTFVEGVLWAVIRSAITGPNPFVDREEPG